ncbi:hypothetical protein [Streptomyces orinoci]|uniref:Integral membrane protein n=1 Tax=Streptomyces orinoci TaxID=67339 RepID=A0ABV3JSS6_STRON|nr:hypothetical protein [Streptomyces orinoci]
MSPSVTARPDQAAREATGIATDPVRTLLHRHHTLCSAAVDPLEIAAALEADGITDRVAAEYRHRDVFSLAEELHARAAGDQPEDVARPLGAVTAPSTGCAVRPGRSGWGARGTLAWLWLVGYGLVGDRLLWALLHRGHRLGLHALGGAAAPTALALACVVAPAAWCAHWFTATARRALAGSRSLAEVRARLRPVLLVAVTVFTGLLLGFLWSARSALPPGRTAAPVTAYGAVAALGALLFLARLLAGHGLVRTAVTATAAAALAEALALAVLLAARLPGCGALAWPLDALTRALGPAALPLAACAVPALALVVHAFPALTRASAHWRGDPASASGTGADVPSGA